MAKISTYPYDNSISGSDTLVGTDYSTRQTKQFGLGSIQSWLISSGSVITGGGTLNTIAMFTPDGQTVGDSIITYDDTFVPVITVGGRLVTSGDLIVNGRGSFSGDYVRFDCPIEVREELKDSLNSSGTAGQVLSSTGTGVQWTSDTDTTYDLTGQVSNVTDFAIGLTGSDGTLDKVTLIAGSNITLTDNGSNGVTIASSSSGGTVTGTGTTNTLPVWTDGPNGEIGDSKVYQDNSNIYMLAGSSGGGAKCDYSFGVETLTGQKQGTVLGFAFKTGGQSGGYYKSGGFRFENKLAVGRNSDPTGATLDVGKPADLSPAAYFRNGVVLSNNPGGVQVDNTSMVIGTGNNDIVSGSDNCLAVGNGNQILTNSDNGLAVGQGNIIRNVAANSFAIGQSNIIDGTGAAQAVRSQLLGFNNTLTGSYSSFIAGGQNEVTTGNNAFALGFQHILEGEDSQFAFGENCRGPVTGVNTFMIGSALEGSDKTMVIGYRNNASSYPATDYSQGLGETKFVISVGSNSNSNAIIITEGGVDRGVPNVAQEPRIIMPSIVAFDYADDIAAAAAGIPIGGIYHNAGALRIRRT